MTKTMTINNKTIDVVSEFAWLEIDEYGYVRNDVWDMVQPIGEDIDVEYVRTIVLSRRTDFEDTKNEFEKDIEELEKMTVAEIEAFDAKYFVGHWIKKLNSRYEFVDVKYKRRDVLISKEIFQGFFRHEGRFTEADYTARKAEDTLKAIQTRNE